MSTHTHTHTYTTHPLHHCRPRTSNELLQNIVDVCGGDHSAVSLTQEILVYLAMFIRSEPDLFTEIAETEDWSHSERHDIRTLKSYVLFM